VHIVDLVARELLYFALFWFIIGAIDEIAIDVIWLWLRGRGRAVTRRWSPEAGATFAQAWTRARTVEVAADPHIAEAAETATAALRFAVLIPAWREAQVIDATVQHMLAAWPDADWRLYVGCYRNDPATVMAVMRGAGRDPRVRVVIHARPGPTTKADCLNRLHAAVCTDEARGGWRYHAIVMHDAEDMVHPLALAAIGDALGHADFVQLPVRPEPVPGSRWVSGHYCDEFTEAHAKALVVRHALGAAVPAAGVGCGITRDMLDRITCYRRSHGEAAPFPADCLTEDYELGLLVAREGGHGCFLRLRDPQGQLIATRAMFPPTLPEAVRQKTRWIHGIALQSWDRLGWVRRPVEVWMALRDRRGPLNALVLAVAYLLLVIDAARLGFRVALHRPVAHDPVMAWLLAFGAVNLVWRAGWRCAFTAREYGWSEGLRSIPRMPVANVITIMAGRRAFVAYLRTLAGGAVIWDKTEHRDHPARAMPAMPPMPLLPRAPVGSPRPPAPSLGSTPVPAA
jgi:adsorption protein B